MIKNLIQGIYLFGGCKGIFFMITAHFPQMNSAVISHATQTGLPNAKISQGTHHLLEENPL
jgi:hypothetical protein